MHQSIPAEPSSLPPPLPPSPGYCEAFANFALANPGFLSEYNYTEDFTGKQADWLICQGQEKVEEVCKDMFSILCIHCLSSQNYIAKSGAIDVNQRFLVIESNFC